ncbi:hypothetical protein LP085_31025, partial [Achromobacter sp. MY14]|uniref:hypothetical protein n=1 Tax=unclassified Achromobacter TaxID=2626865 RepID=UPI001E50B027
DFGLRAMVGLLENHHRPAHKNPDSPRCQTTFSGKICLKLQSDTLFLITLRTFSSESEPIKPISVFSSSSRKINGSKITPIKYEFTILIHLALA